jgi:hypothetical protein
MHVFVTGASGHVASRHPGPDAWSISPSMRFSAPVGDHRAVYALAPEQPRRRRPAGLRRAAPLVACGRVDRRDAATLAK